MNFVCIFLLYLLMLENLSISIEIYYNNISERKITTSILEIELFNKK